MIDSQLIIKKGTEFSEEELSQVKDSIKREFRLSFELDEHSADNLYFLLKKGREILAMGALGNINPVHFNGNTYSLLGVLNVISNIKGKGYGKVVVSAMREYMVSKDMAGLGFCHLKNKEFYEKCGFNINTVSTHRFLYKYGNEKIRNQDGQIIFYQDSSSHFFEKVFNEPEFEVILPTKNLW